MITVILCDARFESQVELHRKYFKGINKIDLKSQWRKHEKQDCIFGRYDKTFRQ